MMEDTERERERDSQVVVVCHFFQRNDDTHRLVNVEEGQKARDT